jgi:hypothetical protein
MLQTPPNQGNGEDEDPDPSPCDEDEDFFQGSPDAEDMEEAISKFLEGMEEHELSGFDDLYRLLGGLPKPVQKKDSSMTHAAGSGGSFKPEMEYLIRSFLEIYHFFLEILRTFNGVFLRLRRSENSFSVGGTCLC